jgi:hypothetical protein
MKLYFLSFEPLQPSYKAQQSWPHQIIGHWNEMAVELAAKLKDQVSRHTIFGKRKRSFRRGWAIFYHTW